jgi:hypothetical protein
MMLDKMVAGKKGGGVGDVFVIVGSMLLYVIMLTVFSIMLLGSKACSSSANNALPGPSSTYQTAVFLTNYLRTPVDVSLGKERRNMTAAELIMLWAGDNNAYESQLRNATKKIINASYDTCAAIMIYTIDYARISIGPSFTVENECDVPPSFDPSDQIMPVQNITIPLDSQMGRYAVVQAVLTII